MSNSKQIKAQELAKQRAKAIAALDAPESLIDILKRETASLKVQYIELTLEWAEKEYERQVEMSKWTQKEWAKWLGVETREEPIYGTNKTRTQFAKGFYNTKASSVYDRALTKASNIESKGKSYFMQQAKKSAEEHYEGSIQKLAFRIEQKGLDQSKLKVKTSHIGVNIDTTLTDGNKTVKAFTIIASGAVQRPHYRYLIK